MQFSSQLKDNMLDFNLFAWGNWSSSNALKQVDILQLVKFWRQFLCIKTFPTGILLIHLEWAWSSEHPRSSLKLIRLIIPSSNTVFALSFWNPSVQITQQSSSKLLATPEGFPLAMETWPTDKALSEHPVNLTNLAIYSLYHCEVMTTALLNTSKGYTNYTELTVSLCRFNKINWSRCRLMLAQWHQKEVCKHEPALTSLQS